MKPRPDRGLRLKPQRGVTLMELALLLAITGVLAVGTMTAMTALQQARKSGDAAAYLSASRQALRAFVLRENRLPCPDLTGSGHEGNGDASACPAGVQVGRFPYLALRLDKPVLPDGIPFVRYGVWRAGGSDLVLRPAALPAGESDADGSSRFAANLLLAGAGPGGTGHPYMAGAHESGEASNCGIAATNPAVVLAISPGDGNCFTDAPEGGPRVQAIGKYELLGWFRAR
ncbi:MAG: type II secretion system protein [Polaromonas sp.]|nr:type II secretion system protein [Polaromonas sp.]